jgi:hypothetical protein
MEANPQPLHEPLPFWLVILPAGHSAHFALPVPAAKLPLPHAEHSVSPALAANLPVAHAVHGPMPPSSESLKVPGLQSSQVACPASEIWPAAQVAHEADPADAAYFPAAHRTQASRRCPPGVDAAPSSVDRPAGQSVQLVRPACVVIFPAGQRVHRALPLVSEKYPGLQGRQTLEPPIASDAAGRHTCMAWPAPADHDEPRRSLKRASSAASETWQPTGTESLGTLAPTMRPAAN